MSNSIKMSITFLVLFSTFSLALESNKTFIPIIMDSIITFAVIDNGPDIYEATLTSNDDVVLIQKSTKLMWVNEPDESKGKCAKIHKNGFRSEFEKAKGFCKSKQFGNFAGLSKWRTPTAKELKIFIKATKDMDVNYDAPCNKLLALKNSNITNETIDSSYTTISTRFNNDNPIAVDLKSLKPNIGLRCVRTITEEL